MSLVSKMSQSTTERSLTGPQFWKSTLDFVLAFVLLVLTAPVMILAIVIVHLTSPGPVIYSQTAPGPERPALHDFQNPKHVSRL